MTNLSAVVVGCHWRERRSELGFVVRSIAGAASRCGPVAVLVPGDPTPTADGAFDLQGMGPEERLQWPHGVPVDTTVIADDVTAGLASLLTRTAPRSVRFLAEADGAPQPEWRKIQLVGGDDPLHVHVPVNRLAERHRHHGFGFTDYLLVLSDREGENEDPPPAAAWVSAGFNDAEVIVVENAVASAWKGRSLRGKVTVDTRMDFWRLLAHANVCIDLAPGPYIARECIEALRFGTPIIVPDEPSPGAQHARASGGATFRDPSELLGAIEPFRQVSHRVAVGKAAHVYANTTYGDPASLVRRLRTLLAPHRPVQ